MTFHHSRCYRYMINTSRALFGLYAKIIIRNFARQVWRYCLLFYTIDISYCKACGQCYSCSPSEHLVLFCKNNESNRKELWARLIERFGSNFYLWFISLSPFNQAVSLLSIFEHVLIDENDKRSAMKIVIFTLWKCYIHVSDVKPEQMYILRILHTWWVKHFFVFRFGQNLLIPLMLISLEWFLFCYSSPWAMRPFIRDSMGRMSHLKYGIYNGNRKIYNEHHRDVEFINVLLLTIYICT